MTWQRRPGEGRYAQREYERRYVLGSLPAGLTTPRTVEDHYLVGTRLRLRRVSDGAETVHKLCQKVRPDESDPSVVSLTNIYLPAHEYARLRELPAHALHKTRWHWRHAGHTFAVDEFTGRLTGLLLAEVELPDPAAEVAAGPPIVAEVTRDDRYSGGYLARAGGEQVAELVRGRA